MCVFIGGGGYTEIAIYDKEIKESVNTKIGVIDVILAENILLVVDYIVAFVVVY